MPGGRFAANDVHSVLTDVTPVALPPAIFRQGERVERKEGALVKDRTGLWLWPILATARLRGAVRQHWRRILVGAFVGWVFAVVGGAFALASLEFHHVITRSTSDDLGIVLVLYGVGVGALNAYALRPAPHGR
jgi:hypothetical protein